MGPLLVVAVLLYSGGLGTPTRDAPAGDLLRGGRSSIVAALRSRGLVVLERAIDEAVLARREGWRSVAELAFLARGKAAFDRGRHARERVELEDAARHFAEAEAAYGEGLVEPGVASLCAEAALEHGVTLGELGRLDEARAAFARALAWSPRLPLTERHARPDVVRLFREVARTRAAEPPASPPRGEARDLRSEQVLALRAAPSSAGVSALMDALGLDATLVLAAAADGRHLLAARVEARCNTRVVALGPIDGAGPSLDAALATLLAQPCSERELGLRLDDARLAPVQVVSPIPPRADPAMALPRKAPRRWRGWPFIVAGALGVTAAVVGVTVGVIASDPRYSLHVDGPAFGAR